LSRMPATADLDSARDYLAYCRENRTRTDRPVDHRSFRDQLSFSIGFAVTRSRELLRRILKEHAPDDARQQLAAQVIEHLEQSGFEIDEAEQVMRKRPPSANHD
jgi:DNA-directed RNA polymerase specialized sigma54-like protein